MFLLISEVYFVIFMLISEVYFGFFVLISEVYMPNGHTADGFRMPVRECGGGIIFRWRG